MEQRMLIGLPDATLGHCSHYHLHHLVLLLGFQVQVHPLFQLYLNQNVQTVLEEIEERGATLGRGQWEESSLWGL